MGGHGSARKPSALQRGALVLLRVGVGWHLLYEGVSKLLEPGWTCQGYLMSSRWIFAEYFHQIAANPDTLRIADLLNMWGLTILGVCLMAGFFSRLASLSGMALVLLYYIAHPPFLASITMAQEGHYLFVDKNLVEIAALAVLTLFPTGAYAGLDRFYAAWRERRRAAKQCTPGLEPTALEEAPVSGRRIFLQGVATLPFLAAFGVAVARKHHLGSHEEKKLVDAVSGATIKQFNFSALKDLKGQIPVAPIGNKTFSRMILGGNLIGGWAHARDLIYVSTLVKAYHTRAKIFETFMLAEQCGVNAILTNPILCDVINQYWNEGLGKIQFISDCGGDDLLERIRLSIDKGAAACYVQGGTADRLVNEGKVELIGQALEMIRREGLPAGIGAHELNTVRVCVDQGFKPDFWMKTLHRTDYWSAQHPEEHDNIFCKNPTETIDFMAGRKEPWIAFKTLAAGAIDPNTGFRFAFENGADFICVGMYDFQMIDNANLALDILNGPLNRSRPWMA